MCILGSTMTEIAIFCLSPLAFSCIATLTAPCPLFLHSIRPPLMPLRGTVLFDDRETLMMALSHSNGCQGPRLSPSTLPALIVSIIALSRSKTVPVFVTASRAAFCTVMSPSLSSFCVSRENLSVIESAAAPLVVGFGIAVDRECWMMGAVNPLLSIITDRRVGRRPVVLYSHPNSVLSFHPDSVVGRLYSENSGMISFTVVGRGLGGER